ncbi:formate dehydrogenase accessory sulfurtransferase FdhD [Romboutsia sp. 1001713B170207_170306_H8]|uniref:formate dehydrogenase accessory sulfurtransferase FdhD n=1 Tax=Romboutsia sp. 1001713B170207_170306_H8 TaxID=2787112 RepID=UPI00082308EE|nr:formate dehydrogenase accessory sulfurtransferase FdhD [Romboutsia sp. 1001713B170207_170306_H8]SCI21770.1 formate dehydrogenase accessory protein [uncultured Clostridium sp.]
MNTLDHNDEMKAYRNTFKVPIIKLDEFSYRHTEDTIIAEYPLSLVLNGKFENTFLCTPTNLKELIIGYLLTKGCITSKEDLISMVIDKENKVVDVNIKDIENINLDYNSINSKSHIYVDHVYEIMESSLNHSKLFKDTGGVHSVAIFEGNKETISYEDVARHNAMDKAIGHCILHNINFDNKAIAVSGRISYEMLLKVAKAKIPIVISKSAPTNLSVELAKKSNITLIGFVRGKRMNIYTHSYRVKI